MITVTPSDRVWISERFPAMLDKFDQKIEEGKFEFEGVGKNDH